MDTGFPPAPKPERLSADVLATIHDDDLEFALLDYVVHHMLGDGDGLQQLADWPLALQAWYVAFVLDNEVLNGGFNQFFFNPSRALAPAAPAALAQIGAPAIGELVSRALVRFDSRASTWKAARVTGTLEAFAETSRDESFTELDDVYFEREEQTRLARLRFLRRQAPTLRHP
jgi:Domain of unknown function (DUF4375)